MGSAFPSEANIGQRDPHVSFVPKSENVQLEQQIATGS